MSGTVPRRPPLAGLETSQVPPLSASRQAPPPTAQQATSTERPQQQLPDLRDPRFRLERETLKLVVDVARAVWG